MTTALQIAQFLDKTLRVSSFEDRSHNGLQVASQGSIARVCCGVDASLEFFEASRRRGASFLVCHHGISWGDSLRRITDLNYERISFLMRHNIALYACHLPLDAHPKCGNNARICAALGIRRLRPFGLYSGKLIGFGGRLPRPVSYARFLSLVEKHIGPARCMPFGKSQVQSIAVVSGGAASHVAEAAEQGYDVFLSGEPALSAYHEAKERGIHAVFAGHYATETFGVKAVADLLHKRFRLPAEFVDFKIGF
jgi:dinuclear metal center YbgI/SA1388 family protein